MVGDFAVLDPARVVGEVNPGVGKREGQLIARFGGSVAPSGDDFVVALRYCLSSVHGVHLRGILKASARYETEQSKKEYAWEQSAGDLGRAKYLNEIITKLYEHGGKTQAELAEALGINPSTLSERLKRINDTDFILTHKAGKYKYFELSEYGRKYYIALRNKRNELEKNSERYTLYYKMLSTREEKSQRTDCVTPEKLVDQIDEKKERKKIDSNVISFSDHVMLKEKYHKRKTSFANNNAKDGLVISNKVRGIEDEDVREN